MTVTYPHDNGWWILASTKPETMERTFNALAGNAQFQGVVKVSGSTVTAADVELPFSVQSPNMEWSCEENKTQTSNFTLPDGAILTKSDGSWSEIGGRYENKGCTVQNAGTSVTASCSVRGGNKDCFLVGCNCAGGGHGKVTVSGLYKISQRTTTELKDVPVATTLLSNRPNNLTYVTLPARPDTRVRTVTMEIRRVTNATICDKIYDQVTLQLPDQGPGVPPVQGVTQTSVNGEFEVRADQTQVVVQRRTPPVLGSAIQRVP